MNKAAIYPGSFHPPVPWKNSNHRGNGVIVPASSIARTSDLIEFRCWIPGVRREDIQLILRNHRLSLSVCSSLPEHTVDPFRVLRYGLERMLPMETDTAWFAAEYQNGQLVVRFSTSIQDPVELPATPVVVY